MLLLVVMFDHTWNGTLACNDLTLRMPLCVIGPFDSCGMITWFAIGIQLISLLYLNDTYVGKKCRWQWLEICVGLPVPIYPPICLHSPKCSLYEHPQALCIHQCVAVSLYTHIHICKNCARTSPPHFHTSISYSTPTHPSYLLSCVSASTKMVLSASPSVCSALSISISIHLSLSTFFPLWGLVVCTEAELRAASSLQSRHLSSELSWFLVPCDISTCGDLTSVVSCTSHCHTLLKERMSGPCARTEKHLHTHFV